MKNLFFFFALILFSLQLATAQPATPDTPETSTISTSTHSSNTKIDINIDQDQKLKLRTNDHSFDMDLNFEKINTHEIRNILSKHLGKPQSYSKRMTEWKDEYNNYQVKLRKGKLEVFFDKDELSSIEFEKFMAFAKDVFDMLDWKIDINDL